MKLARLIVYARVTSSHLITAHVHNRNLLLLDAVFFAQSNEHIFKYFEMMEMLKLLKNRLFLTHIKANCNGWGKINGGLSIFSDIVPHFSSD